MRIDVTGFLLRELLNLMKNVLKVVSSCLSKSLNVFPCHQKWKSDQKGRAWFRKGKKESLNSGTYMQSSAVITRSCVVRGYIKYYKNWGRISIRCWIHKRQPGELWSVFYEYLWENWPRYNGTALYYSTYRLPVPLPLKSIGIPTGHVPDSTTHCNLPMMQFRHSQSIFRLANRTVRNTNQLVAPCFTPLLVRHPSGWDCVAV